MTEQASVTLASSVAAAPDQVSADLGGEAAILQLGSGMYYGLDAVGARIWTLLREPHTVREIRDALLAEYDVAAARLEADLVRFLNALAAHRLIEVRDAARAP
jgi:hypothetical protein